MKRRKNELFPGEHTFVFPKDGETLSFDDAVNLFLKEQVIKNRTPRTIEWHIENFHVLKKAFHEQGIPLDLKTITTNQLKHNFILYSIKTFKNQPTTINNRLKTFKAFWKFLLQEGYVDTDIAAVLDKLKEKQKVIISLDNDEIEAFFKACDKKTFTGLRDLAILKTLLDTGARVSEVRKLRVQDIYWRDDLLCLDGKGSKERFVPLGDELKKPLREYLNARGKLPTDVVFVSIDNEPMANRTIQGRLETLAKKAGVKKKSSPHIWRHTFAKLYILNGGDPFTLKKILGHADWGMVHRYVDMFSTDIKKQHQRFSPLKNL
ncbi:MAG: tyrosine-type recombinase/integrase [Dethiobacter sp.]|jgi:integrase/recombinase XerD|nr:tyrosine-type recombinase/integrase [Dethiobacter sp.]